MYLFLYSIKIAFNTKNKLKNIILNTKALKNTYSKNHTYYLNY